MRRAVIVALEFPVVFFGNSIEVVVDIESVNETGDGEGFDEGVGDGEIEGLGLGEGVDDGEGDGLGDGDVPGVGTGPGVPGYVGLKARIRAGSSDGVV